jgi:hypothetical protein
VPDLPEKLKKLLDGLLPFLETSPPWLKEWVYVWIILSFITIAVVMVSYLISKINLEQKKSLEYFTIDQPRNDGVIPLGDNRSWSISGKFPLAEYDVSVPPISVDVYKQPEHDRIQHGEVRPDNVWGTWLFEPLKFPGDGSFEIVVSATLNKSHTEHVIQVKCLPKRTAYEESITKVRELRGAKQLSLQTGESVSLPDVYTQLGKLQDQLLREFLSKEHPTDQDLTAALRTVFEALNMLDPVLPLFPDDPNLQNFRASFLKDYAQIMLAQNRTSDAARFLDEATKMFEAIHQQYPHDANAWNGLGTVAAMRGDAAVEQSAAAAIADYRSALFYIDESLKIEPDNQFALSDQKLAQKKLRELEEAAPQHPNGAD